MKISLLPLISYLMCAVAALCSVSCSRPHPYRIGVSQCSLDDWRDKLNEEIEREMIFYPEAEVEIRSANDDIATQIDDVRYFIDNKFDIIIISPIEAQPLTPIVKEAYDGGIPVVTFDRTVEGEAYTAHIGADNRLIGRAAGDYVAGRLGNKGKVAEIAGLDGSTPAEERHAGLVEALDSAGGITLVATAYSDWTDTGSAAIADSLLRLHPDLDAVVAQNDRMGLAVREAAGRYGMNNLIVTGVDAVDGTGIDAVGDGRLDVSFIYPTGGAEIIRTAMNILHGQNVERNKILASAIPVDAGNVRMMRMQEEALRDNTHKINELKGQLDRYSAMHSEQRMLIYAIIFILLLSAIFIFVLLRTFWQRRRDQAALSEQNERLKKQTVQLEEQKAILISQRDQMAELNDKLNSATSAKLAFFTNVSHDLRTPLTLIAEPLRILRGSASLSPDERSLVGVADKNAKILMRLINQVLDFRKYENGKLALNLQEVQIGLCLAEWQDAFRPLAMKRHIKLKVDNSLPSDFNMAVDPEKLERVFFNIMSNAFKFTPDNGTIETLMSLDVPDILTIRVSDTGRGMNSDEVKRVFERFYQADRLMPGGSGIGLAVAKAFATMHGGDITVESREGEGSVFTITVPVRHIEAPVVQPQALISGVQVSDELGDTEISQEIVQGDDTPTVLVIDDNQDIRTMLRQLLGADYTVIEAADGRQGIRMAAKYLPDVVVCDMMMPVMDGLECCRHLKEETATSHIPVLMLTACALDEQRREGYEQGADGYLSKPFSGDVLKARIRSLIDNRHRLMKSLTDGVMPVASKRSRTERADATKAQPADLDTEFYRTFVEIVEREMANADLTTEQVGEMMGFSRTQLYRKLKALTNYSPNELIRNMRLRRAKELLAKTEDSVSQIAYAVGFNSPSYFSKCFKECFGELPADVQKRTSRPS